MSYTAHQIADFCGISIHTLRYYIKEGLLPFVGKTSDGLRKFEDQDIEWLTLLQGLKNSGMTIQEMKQFVNWVEKGDETISQRWQMFEQQRQKTKDKIKSLQKTLALIENKCLFYEKAIQKGNISEGECWKMNVNNKNK